MVLTVSFVISPVIGLDCHRRFARLSAKLNASVEASGPHDFAVRVQPRSSAVLTIASIASRPASVTIASAPWWDETARLGKCFASNGKQDIFANGAGQVICETAEANRRGPHKTSQQISKAQTGARQEYLYTLRVIGPAGYTTYSCHERTLP